MPAGTRPIEPHAAPSPPGRRPPARWPWLVAGSVWCGFIVGTSSTVILPHDLFAWLARHVFMDETSFRAFTTFWRYSWFAIVKGWHAAEFAILLLIVLTVLNRFRPPSSRRNVAIALALSLTFAVSDEYHQTFVLGRSGTWTDVAIDGSGASLAGLIALGKRRP